MSELMHKDIDDISIESEIQHIETNQRYWDTIGQRVEAYDPASPEAAHLRPHQLEAIERFREAVIALQEGEMKGGMAILHPTGSGKTVTTAEITRMLCDTTRNGHKPVRALMLVPGHQILGQTVGSDEERGAIRTFAPHLTVGEYSGKRKTIDADVTVMNYQALPGAVRRGDISEINPEIIICDEAHHIIDGVWADLVEEISTDRICLGLTATPSYTETRSVSRLFPNILVRKTMKEGIEDGMLAEMRGFVYKGGTRISITRKGADYAEEDMFNALSNSQDNYLAAKICAQEVANGRRGVVSCVPGFDRAHAKIMAEILNQTKVQTEEGERYVRAAFVGGEVHEKELKRVFDDYKAGRLDVITYVNLLLEGWDSPESDFTVLLRPTKSRVLAEQRIGRIIRPRPGKVATVHEIIYEFEGTEQAQVTHMDIMESKVIRQGYNYKRKDDAARAANRRWKAGAMHTFFAEDYTFDPELASRIAELEAVPLEEMRIACGQESIPLDWLTPHIVAGMFGMDRGEVSEILRDAGIPSRSDTYSDIERIYYPPRAIQIIGEHLGLKTFPDDHITISRLLTHFRSSEYHNRLSIKTLKAALEENEIEPTLFMTEDGRVLKGYPPESLEIYPVPLKRDISRQKQPKEIEVDADAIDANSAAQWLRKILIHPSHARTGAERRDIMTGQSALIRAIEQLGRISISVGDVLHAQIQEHKLEPSDQMKNVMSAKNLDFLGLMVAATKARKNVLDMEKAKRITPVKRNKR